jgi:Arc/MetJ family transcription regulator
MRLSVTLDPELIGEAVRLPKARSKRQAIELALKEFVRHRQLKGTIARAGRVPLALSVEDLLKSRAAEWRAQWAHVGPSARGRGHPVPVLAPRPMR